MVPHFNVYCVITHEVLMSYLKLRQLYFQLSFCFRRYYEGDAQANIFIHDKCCVFMQCFWCCECICLCWGKRSCWSEINFVLQLAKIATKIFHREQNSDQTVLLLIRIANREKGTERISKFKIFWEWMMIFDSGWDKERKLQNIKFFEKKFCQRDQV